MSKISLTDLSSLANEQSAIALVNTNNAEIKTKSDTFVSRLGTSPNAMQADFDMNSNRILNLPAPVAAGEPLRVADITGLLVTTIPGNLVFASGAEAIAGTATDKIMSPARTHDALENFFQGSLAVIDVVNPAPGASIILGATIHVTKADGSVHLYRALSNFTWGDIIAHEYGATPTILALAKPKINFGACVIPSGYATPPFTLYYGKDRVQTSLDDDDTFRNTYSPAITNTADVFYVDQSKSDDSGDGLSWATARKTLAGGAPSIISTVGSTGRNYKIYVKANGTCMDRSAGLSFASVMHCSYSIIVVNDQQIYFGNTIPASEMTFSADGTYPKVFISSTSGLAYGTPGRVCDLTYLETIIDERGKTHKIPVEYVAKTSKVDVATTPGSYWFDVANTNFYIHKIGGTTPLLNTDVVIMDTTAAIDVSYPRKTCYFEGVTFLGGVNSQTNVHNAFYNRCKALYGLAGGFMANNNFILQGTKDCITVDAAQDGFDYSNQGTLISAITKANPGVFTAAGHGLVNGDTVNIHAVTFGGAIGMTQVLDISGTVAGATTDTFNLGIDTTSYTTYTTNTAAVQLPSYFFQINPSAIRSGNFEGSNQGSSAHFSCKGITVNGEYKETWRDSVFNVVQTEHLFIGTKFNGTRVNTPDPSNPNTHAGISEGCKLALDRVDWGGYTDPGKLVFNSTSTHPIQVLNTEVPPYGSYANVSATWS